MSAGLRAVLAVAAGWLMPWRAARVIRAQREEIALLIELFALTELGIASGIGSPRMGGWWNLPHPLAVALAALMPWRAVAELRGHQTAFRRVTDGFIAVCRQYRPAVPGAKPRHLHAVGAVGDEQSYSGRHLKGVPRLRPR